MQLEILDIIKSVVSDYFESQGINKPVDVDTVLFGNESAIDSMGLVTIVVDIESKLLEKGIEISLLSEQAMSLKNSPFRTISTLSEFIIATISSKTN